MNVLILTPDAVGSTLLQRLITIYMQFNDMDRPVINLHELTNGLAKYFSPDFNQEIVGKKPLKDWGYFQSLSEIAAMLDSVSHYKTSRLAHYHIIKRGDSLEQQIPFYQYLNENFFIISCRRKNLFEHALSLALTKVTKKLNVYSVDEKVHSLWTLYQKGVELDTKVVVDCLEAYKHYLSWSQQYFDTSSYFVYEEHISMMEKYILSLPVFAQRPRTITWQENFGIDLNDYNRYHYLKSDIGTMLLESPKSYLMLGVTAKQGQAPNHAIDAFIDQNHTRSNFARFYQRHYDQCQETIGRMVELGIMVSGPPIKKQTLAEKRLMIKNFGECLDAYNRWADKNPNLASTMEEQDFAEQNNAESSYWKNFTNLDPMLSYQPPSGQS